MESVISAATAVQSFFNSNFFVALTASALGAYAGAKAAYRASARDKKIDSLLSEIRNTNAAISVSHAACNSMLSVKKQHIQPLHDTYLDQKKKTEQYLRKQETDNSAEKYVFHLLSDLKDFGVPDLGIDTLKQLVFQDLSPSPRTLGAVTIFAQYFENLQDALRKRREVITRLQEGKISRAEWPYYYFGWRLDSGVINQEYPDSIDAIATYTDDIIFFASLICDELVKHGGRLANRVKKDLKQEPPRIYKVNFDKAKKQGLIPSEDYYKDWLDAYPRTGVEGNEVSGQGQ